MDHFKPLSVVGQLVVYLRDAISKGELTDTMPGIRKLASNLGVSLNTVIAAVEQLEKEGFLEHQGHGRRSKIVLPENFSKPGFRVTLLLYERVDIQLDYVVEIQRRLKENGHIVRVADKSLVELGMDIKRIARMVNATKTDAWVVFLPQRKFSNGLPSNRYQLSPCSVVSADCLSRG